MMTSSRPPIGIILSGRAGGGFLLELLTQSAAKFSLLRHWRTGSQLYRDRTRASDDGTAGRSRPTRTRISVVRDPHPHPLGFLSYYGLVHRLAAERNLRRQIQPSLIPASAIGPHFARRLYQAAE